MVCSLIFSLEVLCIKLVILSTKFCHFEIRTCRWAVRAEEISLLLSLKERALRGVAILRLANRLPHQRESTAGSQ
jgi:hypothetical protein